MVRLRVGEVMRCRGSVEVVQSRFRGAEVQVQRCRVCIIYVHVHVQRYRGGFKVQTRRCKCVEVQRRCRCIRGARLRGGEW